MPGRAKRPGPVRKIRRQRRKHPVAIANGLCGGLKCKDFPVGGVCDHKGHTGAIPLWNRRLQPEGIASACLVLGRIPRFLPAPETHRQSGICAGWSPLCPAGPHALACRRRGIGHLMACGRTLASLREGFPQNPNGIDQGLRAAPGANALAGCPIPIEPFPPAGGDTCLGLAIANFCTAVPPCGWRYL